MNTYQIINQQGKVIATVTGTLSHGPETCGITDETGKVLAVVSMKSIALILLV